MVVVESLNPKHESKKRQLAMHLFIRTADLVSPTPLSLCLGIMISMATARSQFEQALEEANLYCQVLELVVMTEQLDWRPI